MADVKWSAQAAITDPISTDEMLVIDDPGGTPASKRTTLANLGKGLTALPNVTDLTASGTISGDLTGNVTGDVSGNAGTVTTITGLAPDTATTQATQAAITTCANLTTVGTIGTGVWNGTAIEGSAVASTGEVGGTKYLREDGDGTCSWQAVAGGGGDLQDAYDAGNTITVADAANTTFTVTNNDVTNNKIAFLLSSPNGNTGTTMYLNTDDTGTGKSLIIDSEATGATGVFSIQSEVTTGLAMAITTNAATSGGALQITSGTTTGTAQKITVDSLTTGTGLYVYSNTTGDGGSLVKVHNDNVGGNQNCLTLQQDRGGSTALNVTTSTTTGNGIYLDTQTSQTTGTGLSLRSTSGNMTSGRLLSSFYTSSGIGADKTGSLNSLTGSRSLVATTTRNDDYDTTLITRTSVVNNAGATFNAAGSVLKIENIATETAGTLADTVIPLEIANNATVSTNFTVIAKFGSFTVFVSDGTTAEGALTGVEGDICLNGGTGAGQLAWCDSNGTNWTDA